MSIYSSALYIGPQPGEHRPEGGHVSIYSSALYIGPQPGEDEYQGPLPRTYQGSHVYPDPQQHRPTRVDTATIPHHCMPGHHDGCHGADGDANGLAPWLRLSIGDPAADMTIVMPAAAVAALADELTGWLARVWEGGDG